VFTLNFGAFFPIKFVISLREMKTIEKEDMIAGETMKSIKILGRARFYLFTFNSLTTRDSSYSCIVQTSVNALSEFPFICFSTPVNLSTRARLVF